MNTSGTAMKQLAPYLMLGSQLGATVLVLGGIGWWLDATVDTGPALMVVGLVGGSILGLVQFLRSVTRLDKKNRERSLTKKDTEGQK